MYTGFGVRVVETDSLEEQGQVEGRDVPRRTYRGHYQGQARRPELLRSEMNSQPCQHGW